MQVPELEFKEWCALGQKGDDLLKGGQIDAALAAHESLLKRIAAGRVVDSLPVGKSVLSILLCYMFAGDIQSIHKMVTKDIETDDSLEAIGVYALEHGQTEVHDLMIFFTILALMYSNMADNPEFAAQAINRYMQSVCEYSFQEDQSLLPGSLTNWLAFLHDLADGGPIPRHWSDSLNQYIARYGRDLPKNAPIAVAWPTPWVFPHMAPATVFHPDGNITRQGD